MTRSQPFYSDQLPDTFQLPSGSCLTQQPGLIQPQPGPESPPISSGTLSASLAVVQIEVIKAVTAITGAREIDVQMPLLQAGLDSLGERVQPTPCIFS